MTLLTTGLHFSKMTLPSAPNAFLTPLSHKNSSTMSSPYGSLLVMLYNVANPVMFCNLSKTLLLTLVASLYFSTFTNLTASD